jgi:hypothetical protein
MENGTTTPEGQTGAPLAGGASVPAGTGPSVDAGTISLKELESFLGKTYPDKATALKSLKDTQSYVGRKIEAATPVPATDPTVAAELRAMKNELFYSKNPQYDTPELREVISKIGENPADVVNGASFKVIFDKTSGYDKIQKTKTVLESNPRIGQVRNKMSEAKEAAKGRDYTNANKKAVAAVLESYEMQ